jgi:hypothetical protein
MWRFKLQANMLAFGLKAGSGVAAVGSKLMTQTNFSIARTNPTVF